MKIQFRILKHIGGGAYLVHLALPQDQTKTVPDGDLWKHLGVIVMEKADIEEMAIKGTSIIWTTDIPPAPSFPKPQEPLNPSDLNQPL